MERDMDLLPTMFFVSPALLARIAEEERLLQSRFPPPQASLQQFPAVDDQIYVGGSSQIGGPLLPACFQQFPAVDHQIYSEGSSQIGCPLLPSGFQPFPAAEQPHHQQHLKLKEPKREKTTDDELSVVGRIDQGWISRKRLLPGFYRLPGLQSLEPPPVGEESWPGAPGWAGDLSSVIKASQKRLHSSSPSSSSPSPSPLPPLLPSSDRIRQPRPTPPIPPNVRSRLRRKGISDRTRLLAKMMPWERRMDTSTMLQEARKYVKFLEAQVTALQCMPIESRFTSSSAPSPSSARMFGELEKLNRQQLLQVLVKSPLVQDKLCARGLCVFSAEQVVMMRQAVERKKMLMQQQQQQQQQKQMMMMLVSTSTISD